MDIQRSSKTKLKRRIRTGVLALLGLAAIGGVTYWLSKLERALPSVDRSTIMLGTVSRGLMLRQVRGNGTLKPETIQLVPAPTEGRVDKVLVKPGVKVQANTVLVELINPQLMQQALDAEYQVKAAQADLANLRVRLNSDRMTQQAAAATVQADYSQARLQSETDEQLAKEGLVPELNIKLSRVRLSDLENRIKIEKERLEIGSESIKAQVDSQQARVEQLRELYKLKASQVAALKVTAGISGEVQEVTAQVGQQVSAGTNLARVADPSTLKAELRIPETQVKDVSVGQVASIDTRNGLIAGRVARIDPGGHEGTVVVDVTLDGTLPPSARPDINVDGTIELERLENVLFVSRPALGQGQSTVKFFKLAPDGKSASHVTVKLGRSSVTTIEILEGVKEGDQLILSDTQQWDSFDRIRLQ